MDLRTLSGKKKGRVIRVKVAKEPRRIRARVPTEAAIAKVVRKVNKRDSETKQVTRVMENYTLHNSGITAPDWTYPVPPVIYGSAAQNRIGDRIRPKALIVKLHVALNSAVEAPQKPLHVRVMFAKHKKFTSELSLVPQMPVETGQLLDQGDGTYDTYDGTIQNHQFAINRDVWTPIKTLNFMLSRDPSFPAQGAPYKEFTVRIPCPKQFVYETGRNLPENFCPAMAVGYCYVDGTGPDVVATPVMVWAQSFLTYSDD